MLKQKTYLWFISVVFFINKSEDYGGFLRLCHYFFLNRESMTFYKLMWGGFMWINRGECFKYSENDVE